MFPNRFLQNVKWTIKDGVSLVYQWCGWPHNRTRAQIHRAESTLVESEIELQRIALIARATQLSEVEVQQHIDALPTQDMVSGHFFNHIMGVRDRTTLHALICACSPEICVETGVAGGVSSTIILQELNRKQRGHLISIEIQSGLSANYGELIPVGYRDRWQLRIQKNIPLLPLVLEELKQIDFFLHDSRHVIHHMRWEYELAWRYLRPGGCLASHDIIMTTAFDDFYHHTITTPKLLMAAE